jgi:hypothetical protein
MSIRYPALECWAQVENKLDYQGTDPNEPRYAVDRRKKDSQRRSKNAVKTAGIILVILLIAALLLFSCIIGSLPDFRGMH